MDQGLDELIEWLLNKIAFSGLEGLSAREFVEAVKSFYREGEDRSGHSASSEPKPSNDREVNPDDVAHASIVWLWIAKRKDVVITPKTAGRLSLEELLSPSPDLAGSSTAPATDCKNTKANSSAAAASGGEAHLTLSEERLWKVIAGHGPDYKRIPLFEWRALIAIASVGEKGILQGDLTRLTGQDKRSLPMRTDALARKGYIIKQQAMLRGCRTSKLWLTQFANNAKADVERQGLPDEVLNTPADELTRSWDPVPFTRYYLGDPLDYFAISQTFLMLVKAYEAMRYCDIRTKMDINHRVPQMRALAKSSRWWARVGVVRFEPMKTSSKGKVFKDCVKFVRDPTKDEWIKYRSTPKANLKVPSSRLRNNKKPTAADKSITDAATQPRRLGKKPLPKQAAPRIPPSPALIRLSAWDLYKPITSTFFEIIKRSGSQGSSNTELGMFNLGWPYRKFISTLTTMISLPRSLPPHLQSFAVHSDFTRLGKTMTYKFYADGVHARISDQNSASVAPQEILDAHEAGGSEGKNAEMRVERYAFPDPSPGQFVKPGSRVKGFLPLIGVRAAQRAGFKRSRDLVDDRSSADVKRARLESPEVVESTPIENEQPIAIQPGVYYGKKNSLDPVKSMGRPRKSIVMKFVFPALQDPEFFNQSRPRPGVLNSETALPESRGEEAVDRPPETDAETTSLQTPSQQRTPKRGRASGSKPFRCDKCGGSYKNINGLEYHQKKSQSACNPDWAPLPSKLAINSPTPRRQGSTVADKSKEIAKSSPLPSPAARRQTLPSRRPKLATSEVPVTAQGSRAQHRGVTVHSVTLHNVLEMPSSGAGRTAGGNGLLKRASIKQTQSLNESLDTPLLDRREPTFTSNEAANSQSTDHMALGSSNSNPMRKSNDEGRSRPSFGPSSDKGGADDSTCQPEQPAPVSEQSNKTPEATASVSTKTHQTSDTPSQVDTQPISDGRQSKKVYGRQKESMLRKELTTKLIVQLLDQNDQVLPGDLSLYCLVASKWTQNAQGIPIPAPEWRAFQLLLKSMDRDKLISIHYFGMMSGGALKQISIIHKGYYGKGSSPMPDAISKKIDVVKNRCQELYPIPYIPSNFSLSGEELEICRDLAKRHRNVEMADKKASGSVAKEIPALRYEMPSDRSANSTAGGSKRERRESDDSEGLHDSVRRRKRKQMRRGQDVAPATPQQTTQSSSGLQIIEDIPGSQASKKMRTKRRTSQRRSLSTADDAADWSIEVAPPGLTRALEASSSIHFIPPTTAAMFEKSAALADGLSDEDEDDDDDISQADPGTDLEIPKESNFSNMRTIRAIEDGAWPGELPRSYFMERPEGSFTMAGRFPESRWFLRQNLPQNMREMVDMAQFRRGSTRQSTSRYGEFGSNVEAIEAWERSPEGAYLQNLGNIAPEHIFISLSVEPNHANMKPVSAEWPPETQHTVDDLPDDIRYAASEDDEPESTETTFVTEGPKRRGRPSRDGTISRLRRFIKRSDGNWKHRTLFPVPKRETGRWNKERAVGANIGRDKETELVVAIVIIRKLLGGVDKITDWGMFLRIYPEWSIAGIRKFWIRVSKERASYIEALSKKFDVAFLEAYDKGELAPLNYDDLENYDWGTLINWAVKLETYDGVELPTTRKQFDQDFVLTDPKKDEEDWRELWFHFQTSTYDRLDAASSLQMVLPVARASPPSSSASIGEADLQLARSWVRALCNNKVQATVGAEVRERLLQLSRWDKASLNELLELSVAQLLKDKVISKLFGKGLGQVFKLNNYYEIRLKKFTHTEKYLQALAFKSELDQSFRNNKEVVISINSNDGTIMAMINLQAYGRIRLDDVNFPHVPFGFEPGNYEGRKYPKRYYMFDVKVVPTEKYVYDEDLPIVMQARNVPIPTKGPLGEIPVWCDFFGNLDRSRWVHYVCMVTFALSVKGPMAASASVNLLSPVIEEFEAQLVMDWLDSMGLLEKVTGGHGATVGEWWWLVVGSQIDVKGKGIAEE